MAKNISLPAEEDVSFRDRLATVDAKGRRKWVFAHKPHGKFYTARTIVSLVFFAIFFTLPFIYVNGQPLFLFNIPSARFIIFGRVFWPQDFFIFGLTMVTFVVFIVLFTAAFGRLFCGWVCPQTVFMEMFFRKIEFWIDGDGAAQRLLKNSPWTAEKIGKRVSKHLIFFVISFVIANFFLSYIIGVKELWKIITEPLHDHIGSLMSLTIFSAVFYGVYAFFREQVCTVVCPYGRLQSVLLDNNSMIVAYDYKRGEPRGKFSKINHGLGDCIDCLQCVKVCPTAIDIRNGTQMECVGCTACIDACDHMMEKIGRDKGLIRYASEKGIKNGEKLHYSTRMKLYTGLLCVLVLILSALLLTRKDIDATVMRTPGQLYQERGQDSLTNLYNIKIANKTIYNIPLTVKVEGGGGTVEIIGDKTIAVKKEDESSGTFFVVMPREAVTKHKNSIRLALFEGNRKIDVIQTNFLGPF
jgi:cytochrome c oxidase accessory protein FixG